MYFVFSSIVLIFVIIKCLHFCLFLLLSAGCRGCTWPMLTANSEFGEKKF